LYEYKELKYNISSEQRQQRKTKSCQYFSSACQEQDMSHLAAFPEGVYSSSTPMSVNLKHSYTFFTLNMTYDIQYGTPRYPAARARLLKGSWPICGNSAQQIALALKLSLSIPEIVTTMQL